MLIAPLLTVGCLISVVCLLLAERAHRPWSRAISKLAASMCFVLIAIVLGAWGTRYGQLLLIALLLGMLGDGLLLMRHSAGFMAGLGAFLLSHGFFAASFLQGHVSAEVVVVASALAVVLALIALRWLLPHTPRHFKVPVLLYVAVILVMCVTATGYAIPSGSWLVLAGAWLFAASDLSVARDRFVCQAYVNRLWGLPTYFVAQLLLAWSMVQAP